MLVDRAQGIRGSDSPRAQLGAVGRISGVDWIIVALACVYAFILHFGSLFRFSNDEASEGVSTIVALTIIVFGVPRILRGLSAERLFQVLLFAISWSVLASAIIGYETHTALIEAIRLGGYVALSAVIMSTPFSPRAAFALWSSVALGLLASAVLSVVDFLGWIDIPGANSVQAATDVGSVSVDQAAGFFARRSAMAAVFSLSIAGCFVFAFRQARLQVAGFFFLCGMFGMLCLFFTHNRSGLLSPLIALAAYMWVTPIIPTGRKVLIGLAGLAVAVLVLVGLSTLFPLQTEVYKQSLDIFDDRRDAENVKSDLARVQLLKIALDSMAAAPLGHGFTAIAIGTETMNAHNVITYIAWALGLMAIPVFAAITMIVIARVRLHPGENPTAHFDAGRWALLSWMLHNMTHNSIAMGLGWIALGVVLGARKRLPTVRYV